MAAKYKWLLLVIVASAAITLFIVRSKPAADASVVEPTPNPVSGATVPGEGRSEGSSLVGENPEVESAESGPGQISGEEIDPHSYVEELPMVSVQLPVEPVPASQRPLQAGETGAESRSGVNPAAGAAGVIPLPSGDGASDPATEYVGDPPDLIAPQVVGVGPGGEPSGTTNIEPVDLGEPADITVEGAGEVDLGPAPEDSDPGTVGPAPEDSGG